jgi:hypothetical protein
MRRGSDCWLRDEQGITFVWVAKRQLAQYVTFSLFCGRIPSRAYDVLRKVSLAATVRGIRPTLGANSNLMPKTIRENVTCPRSLATRINGSERC